MDSLYRLGDSEIWQTSFSERTDWKVAHRWINQHLPIESRILDVGCFDGGFLHKFDNKYNCFGIEINDNAGLKAQETGVRIIAKDFASFSEIDSVFDAVTSFDVIEHSEDPFEFLRNIVKVTRQGGFVIISTGNSDAITWKLLGARYWYCSFAEHVSFISPAWCQMVGPALGLEVKQVVEFAHTNATWKRRIGEAMKNLLYAVTPRGFALLRRIGFGGAEYRKHKEMLIQPPGWMSAKDHFICIFKKNVP